MDSDELQNSKLINYNLEVYVIEYYIKYKNPIYPRDYLGINPNNLCLFSGFQYDYCWIYNGRKTNDGKIHDKHQYGYINSICTLSEQIVFPVSIPQKGS